MYYKKLVGSKVYLSPINIEDYLEYTKWVNDMEVAAGLIFANKLLDEESERAALERISKSGYNFAIIDKQKNQAIGNVGFPQVDLINRIAEVGIFIGDKSYWGNGFGREALTLMLDFGFNILNFNNIFLRVYSYNLQAVKCYEKVGFKEAGRLREAKIIAGNAYDDIYMDLLAREFESPCIKTIIDKKISLQRIEK